MGELFFQRQKDGNDSEIIWKIWGWYGIGIGLNGYIPFINEIT